MKWNRWSGQCQCVFFSPAIQDIFNYTSKIVIGVFTYVHNKVPISIHKKHTEETTSDSAMLFRGREGNNMRDDIIFNPKSK